MEKTINKSKSLFLFVIMFLLAISMFGGGTVTANAQTVESNYTVQDIIDNTVFVTFRKGDTAERGKYIIACYYVPNEYYDTSFTYGVVIFPKDYGLKYNLTADYHKQAEANGAAIADVVATKGLPEENGYGINCGLAGILDSNVARTFCFIFYAKDADGNIAYMNKPQFADYESLDVGEMTLEELLNKTELATDMQGSFKTIILKIQELVNSIWIYVVIAMSSVVIVWALYIGIRVIIAQKNEEKINARGMLKGLLIGVIVMFVIAVGAPLLINGLSHWVTW